MNILNFSAPPLLPTYQDLSRKIRNAEEPDNPVLIHQFLAQRPPLRHHSKAAQRTYLHTQYLLLLDTLADGYLPSHWRGQCLNHIYRPLNSLQRMADCEQSKQQVRFLRYELRVTSHALQAGLTA